MEFSTIIMLKEISIDLLERFFYIKSKQSDENVISHHIKHNENVQHIFLVLECE